MRDGPPVHVMRWAPQDWRTSRVRARSVLTGDPMLRLVYVELLFALFEAGGELEADPHALADHLLLPREEIARTLPVLEELGRSGRGGITITDGTLRNARVTEELDREREYRDEQRRRGSRGAAKRWHRSGDGDAMAPDSAGHGGAMAPDSAGVAGVSPPCSPPAPAPAPAPIPTPDIRERGGAGAPRAPAALDDRGGPAGAARSDGAAAPAPIRSTPAGPPTPRRGLSAPPDDLTADEHRQLEAWLRNSDDPDLRALAPRLSAIVAACLDHHRGAGNRRADWVATCRTWLRREAGGAYGRPTRTAAAEMHRAGPPRSAWLDRLEGAP